MKNTVLIRLHPPQGKPTVCYLDDKEHNLDSPSGAGLGLDERVRGAINEALANGSQNFIVDLTSVKWVSSSTVGVVLAWRHLVAEHKGEIVLANPSERVRNVLNHLKLPAILKVFDSLDAAQQYFTKSE